MIYRIKILSNYNKDLLKRIKQDNKDKQELMELYNNLIDLGYTESYSLDRIDKIAAALAENNINYKVIKI